MALKGQNTHYRWVEAKRSHIIDTAQTIGYSTKIAEDMLDDMLNQVDPVIDKVTPKIPKTFPENISKPIFEGMRLMKARLSR